MSTTMKVKTEKTADNTKRRSNGMTEDQVRAALAAVGRRRNDPGYVARLLHDAQEARRRINEEYFRELLAEESN